VWLPRAASESESPPPLEVPPLLQQLDVVRQREEQEQRDLQLHGELRAEGCMIIKQGLLEFWIPGREWKKKRWRRRRHHARAKVAASLGKALQSWWAGRHCVVGLRVGRARGLAEPG
jgi:hypothetical protein